MGEEDNTLLKSVLSKVEDLTTILSKKEDIDDEKFVEIEKTLGEVSQDTQDFEKALKGKDEEIESKDAKIVELQKTVDDAQAEKDKIAHKQLVEEDIALIKKLDKKTEIKDEEALLKSLVGDFEEEEIEKSVDEVLRADIMANKRALKHVTDGDKPLPDGDNPNPTATSEIEKLQKKLDSHGLLEAGDD
jgi:DNA repair exonuclease SbcCD ATPase subunit